MSLPTAASVFAVHDKQSNLRSYLPTFVCFVQGMDGDTFNAAIEKNTVGIYVLKEHEASEESEDIEVVFEGIRVL